MKNNKKVQKKNKNSEGRLCQLGEDGVHSRNYPNEKVRTLTIAKILNIPEEKRTNDEWWHLGEYQVLNGILNENDNDINKGIAVLSKGAQKTPPSVACLMDLGWIFIYKNIDSLAIPYLEKAVELSPMSRDCWALLGTAAIKIGNRELATNAFAQASVLRNATEVDKDILDSLKLGKDLKELRENVFCTKVGLFEMQDMSLSGVDRIKVSVHMLKNMHNQSPEDLDIAFNLATSRYMLSQYDLATTILNQIIGYDPSHANALALKALILQKTNGSIHDQESLYRQAIAYQKDHVLANVNLANILMGNEDFSTAIIHIDIALKSAKDGDPLIATALDLKGNIIGSVDEDYELEAEYHRESIKLNPSNPYFNSNLVISLICANKIKDAKRAFQDARNRSVKLPDEEMLVTLIKVFSDELKHPYEYLQLVDDLQNKLGWKAMRHLIILAWKRRRFVPIAEVSDFLYHIGIIASKSGLNNLALEIWSEGAKLPGGDGFIVNKIVELSNMGMLTEALAATESMPMTLPRSWTVLGNIHMNVGNYKEAVEAYKIALDKDEKFLLPISNAISCIKTGYLVDMVEPFFNKLESDWKNNPEGKLLKAECLVIMGEIQLAKEEFESILIRDEIYLSPTEIRDLCQDAEDLSIISSLDLRHYHYIYAKTLLQLRSFSYLLSLSENSHSWSEELYNGDWNIFTAEVYRCSKQFNQAISIVSSMQLQSPPLLTEALIYRDEGKTNLLELAVDKFFQEIVSDFCFHPSGIPEAVFYALRSNIELEKLNYELAIDLAEKSVLKDPASIECCIALAVALKCSDLKQEAIKVLQTGLSIIPHSPELLSLLIELLIDTQEIENAEAMLVRYRPLLENNNFITDAHRLGELICIAKLAAQNGNFDEKEFCNLQAWNWIDKKTNPVNSWLKGAVIARNRAEYLRTAEVMYFAKVIEYLLVECVFNPFKKYCKNNALELDSKQFQSVSNFINKDMQVSLSGMAKILSNAERSYRSNEELILTKFRDFLGMETVADSRMIRNREFVDLLSDFSRLRNRAAHIQEPDFETYSRTMKLVIDIDQPGLIFQVLGV